MQDKAKQLTKALPDLIEAMNKVLAEYNLDDVSLSQLAFSDKKSDDTAPHDHEVDAMRGARADENIPFCPPGGRRGDYVRCMDPITGQTRIERVP